MMSVGNTMNKILRSALPLSAAAMLLVASPVQARHASAFAGFAGEWAGGGFISLTDGSKEDIRCRANYAVQTEDDALRLQVKCASASYNFQVVSNVTAEPNGTLSGSWQELTRQAQGDVTGRIPRPGQLQASLGGTAYGIQFSAETRGNRQAVAIEAQGTDMRSATINLRKE